MHTNVNSISFAILLRLSPFSSHSKPAFGNDDPPSVPSGLFLCQFKSWQADEETSAICNLSPKNNPCLLQSTFYTIILLQGGHGRH